MGKHAKKKGKLLKFDAKAKGKYADKKNRVNKINVNTIDDDAINIDEKTYYNEDEFNEIKEDINSSEYDNELYLEKDEYADEYLDYQDNIEDIKHNESFSKHGNKQPTNKIMNIIVIALMLLILVFGVVITWDIFSVRAINIIGNDTFGYYDIVELTGIEYEESIFKVDLSQVEKNIEKNPMLEVEYVNRVLPNTIEIVIKERRTVSVITRLGQFISIGEKNLCLDISSHPPAGSYPVLEGIEIIEFELGQPIVSEDKQKLEICYELMEAMILSDCISEISVINISNEANIKMVSVSGIEIEMGTSKNVLNKCIWTKTMLNEMEIEGRYNVKLIITNVDTAHVIEIS